MKTLAIFGFSLFLVHVANGQACPEKSRKPTGVLIATVYDHDSKQPLHRAAVRIVELQKGALTSEATRGQVRIDQVEAGTYTIEASYPGYDKHVITGIEISQRKTPDMRIWMLPATPPRCLPEYPPGVKESKTTAAIVPEEQTVVNVHEPVVNLVKPASAQIELPTGTTDQPTTIDLVELSAPEESTTFMSTIEVYPNPASRHTQLRFHAGPGESVYIRLANSKGDIVLQEMYSPSFTGNHLFPLDLMAVPSGDYFIHLVTHDRSFMRRLSVVK